MDRLTIESVRRIAEDLSGMNRGKRKGNGFWKSTMVMSVLAMQMKAGNFTNQVNFDTDSGAVGIEKRCSGCISHEVRDFEGLLIDTNRPLKQFSGTRTANIKVRTIVWRILDDNGMEHTF